MVAEQKAIAIACFAAKMDGCFFSMEFWAQVRDGIGAS